MSHPEIIAISKNEEAEVHKMMMGTQIPWINISIGDRLAS